jgi:hypothetical protein
LTHSAILGLRVWLLARQGAQNAPPALWATIYPTLGALRLSGCLRGLPRRFSSNRSRVHQIHFF